MENLSEFIMANMGLVFELIIILALIARSLIMPARISPLDCMGAIRLMNSQNALVVDVRGNDEYQKGHILNSLHIPLALLEGKQSEVAPFKDEEIILVCRSGSRSYQAGLTLKKLGYEHLHNLKGGVLAWEQAGLPLTTKPTKGKHKIKKKDQAAELESDDGNNPPDANNADADSSNESSSTQVSSAKENDSSDSVTAETSGEKGEYAGDKLSNDTSTNKVVEIGRADV